MIIWILGHLWQTLRVSDAFEIMFLIQSRVPPSEYIHHEMCNADLLRRVEQDGHRHLRLGEQVDGCPHGVQQRNSQPRGFGRPAEADRYRHFRGDLPEKTLAPGPGS